MGKAISTIAALGASFLAQKMRLIARRLRSECKNGPPFKRGKESLSKALLEARWAWFITTNGA